LSYFSPIAPSKQRHRKAQLWYEIVQAKELFPHRQNTDINSVRRGTLQHEIFFGENAEVWDMDSSCKIKVNCKTDAEGFSELIPYGLFVTFEVAQGIDVDIYTTVINRIRQTIPVATVSQV
jgi:hypothetical protein